VLKAVARGMIHDYLETSPYQYGMENAFRKEVYTYAQYLLTVLSLDWNSLIGNFE
jgi:hypothetical protein